MAEQNSQDLTLMFVDIPTVSAIRDMEGELVVREFVDKCLALLGDIREKHSGELIRSVGSTLLCSFSQADDAVRAACDMQRVVAETDFRTITRATLRMGLHSGPVMMRGGSCTGEVVTTTARMVTIAKPGQVVSTEQVRSRTGAAVNKWFTPLAGAETMEKRLRVRLFDVGWRERLVSEARGEVAVPPQGETSEMVPLPPPDILDNRKQDTVKQEFMPGDEANPDWRATSRRHNAVREMQERMAAQRAAGPADLPPADSVEKTKPPSTWEAPVSSARLCLIWREKVLVLDAKNTSLSMGREESNDITLKVSTASRRHAEIRYRNGAFYLIDRSANGTFVYDETGRELYVEEAECKLGSSGAICPGCPQGQAECEALLFWVQGK
ncbi:MAG: adenylate/guanylate cyclase domain-containing protein [Lentisphaeria bacterium]|jgi:class 3 adenylate cyclase|nr:adenylate/guanylate cyclase domain-containing protein [Lentisphaeria bacterium]